MPYFTIFVKHFLDFVLMYCALFLITQSHLQLHIMLFHFRMISQRQSHFQTGWSLLKIIAVFSPLGQQGQGPKHINRKHNHKPTRSAVLNRQTRSTHLPYQNINKENYNHKPTRSAVLNRQTRSAHLPVINKEHLKQMK